MRTVLWLLAGVVALAVGDARAQSAPSMSTQGNYSPVITGNTASVTVNSGPITLGPSSEELGALLRQANNPISKRLRTAIERGEFAAARSLIDASLAKSQQQAADLALLNYARAATLILERRPLDAEPSMRAAVAMQPANCMYLALESSLLVDLDRLAEADFHANRGRPETADCLQRAEPVSQAVLLYAVVQLAIAHGELQAARALGPQLEALVDEVSRHLDPDRLGFQISVICSLPSVIESFEEDQQNAVTQRAGQRCQAALGRVGQRQSANMQALESPNHYAPPDSSIRFYQEQDAVYSKAIAAAKALKPVPDLGIDADWLGLRLATLHSDRGFARLWELRDMAGAGDDLSAAYRAIKPLLLSGKAAVWASYGFIAIRSSGYIQSIPRQRL